MSFIKKNVDIGFFGNGVGSERKFVSFQEKPILTCPRFFEMS
jgi:hypothetical protein